MEYLIAGIVALIVFIILIIIVKVESIRNKAYALFLEAEKNITEDKLQYVCENLYGYIPNVAKLFISSETFEKIVQKIYDDIRKVSKDILSDGKLDGKEGK